MLNGVTGLQTSNRICHQRCTVLVLDTGGTVEEVQVGELAEQPQCPVHALFGQLIPMCQSEISL